ncbi:MAG: hypothetical protein IPI46_02400 [Bacteroidetes bacterium]|nr:hypothetical protein [Bacteroidota bacterium]
MSHNKVLTYTNTFVIFLCFLIISLFSSCKKKPSAGFGGSTTLQLTAKHHSVIIDSVTFYVKFNTLDAVSNLSEYNYSVKTNNGTVTISELKDGEYYIYAVGWDPSIGNEVNGGIPYKISGETNKSLIVAVTEKH